MNSVDDTSERLGKFLAPSSDDPSSLLTIVLDTNPIAWTALEPKISLRETVASLLVFINGHLSFKNSNKVAAIAAHPTKAQFLYPAIRNQKSHERISNGHTMYRQFREVNETLLDELDKLMENCTGQDLSSSSSSLAGALSMALAYSNRIIGSSEEHMDARILLVSVTGELSSQYIPTMNCIFAAQKKKIPIDVCKLSGDNVFLQQASDSTNGIYMRLNHPKGMIQYLMRAYSIDPSLRQHLVLPTEKEVDFSAACFINKTVVDIGYVCSVCLCIMSIIPANQTCPMCGTQYDGNSLAQLTKKPIVTRKSKKIKTTKSS